MIDINYLINFIRWKLHLISTEEFYRLTPINKYNEPIMEINIDYLKDRCASLTCTSLTEVSFPVSLNSISVTPCQVYGRFQGVKDCIKEQTNEK